jgi:phosphoribosylaminoimidazole-succinocarboxamide synthase
LLLARVYVTLIPTGNDPHSPGDSFSFRSANPPRDWLLASDWNREYPGPELPADVVDETAGLYREIYGLLTGVDVRG